METLLNFDPNRGLGFEAWRALDFDAGRPLGFGPARDLEFTADRDLGFGKGGVVFRVADALPAPPAAMGPEDGGDGPENPAGLPEEPKEGSGAAPSDAYGFCPFCGVQLRAGDEVCWNCRSRASGGAHVTRMPAKPSKPVSREWRRSDER